MKFKLKRLSDGNYMFLDEYNEEFENGYSSEPDAECGFLEALGLAFYSQQGTSISLLGVLVNGYYTEDEKLVSEFYDSMDALVDAGFISLPALQFTYYSLRSVKEYLLYRLSKQHADVDWRPSETVPEDYYAL